MFSNIGKSGFGLYMYVSSFMSKQPVQPVDPSVQKIEQEILSKFPDDHAQLISLISPSLMAIDHHEAKDKKRYGLQFRYPCYVMLNKTMEQEITDLICLLETLCGYPDNTRIILYTYSGHAMCWVFEKYLGRNYFFNFDSKALYAEEQLTQIKKKIPHIITAIPSLLRQKAGSGCRTFTVKDCHHALQLPSLASFRLTILSNPLGFSEFNLPNLFLKNTQDKESLPNNNSTYLKHGQEHAFYSRRADSDINGKFSRIPNSSDAEKFINIGNQHFAEKYEALLPKLPLEIKSLFFRLLSKRTWRNLLLPETAQQLGGNLPQILSFNQTRGEASAAASPLLDTYLQAALSPSASSRQSSPQGLFPPRQPTGFDQTLYDDL